MIQDNEVTGGTTLSPPGYLQQLADLEADCASVLELLESVGLQGKPGEHIGDSRRAVTELCDLVVADTEEVFERGHRWPSVSTELRPQRPDCTPMRGR